MILTADTKTTHAEIERRQSAIKSMSHVLSLPSGSPERWYAAFEHFLRQRPEARYEAAEIMAQVKERRQLMDKFASSKHGRAIMSTPSWLMPLVKQTDPEYFIGKTSKQLVGGRHLTKMKKAFPFFFLPEVI